MDATSRASILWAQCTWQLQVGSRYCGPVQLVAAIEPGSGNAWELLPVALQTRVSVVNRDGGVPNADGEQGRVQGIQVHTAHKPGMPVSPSFNIFMTCR